MLDYLDSLLEKLDDGYKLVGTAQNQADWLKLMEDYKQAACQRYLELYPGTDISASVAAQIWIEGFQMGYIGMLIAAYRCSSNDHTAQFLVYLDEEVD